MRNKKKFFTALATILVTIALLALLAHIVEEHRARQLSQTMDATDSTQTSVKDSVLPAKKVRLYGKKYIYNHQIETYLFLGTDGSGAEDGEGEDYVGSMADSINLLVLDKTDKTYAIIQLNRDTITEIDLMELVGLYISRIRLILVALVIGAVAMGLITFFLITPKYTASTKIYMVSASSGSAIDLTDLNIGTSLSSDYAVLMDIRPIYEDVIADLDLPYTWQQLQGMVSISSISNTRVIRLDVVSANPQEAADIANDMAQKALSYLPELMETSTPHIAETAIVPKRPSSPSMVKNVVLGALVAVVLALAYLTFIYISDDSISVIYKIVTFGTSLNAVPFGVLWAVIADAWNLVLAMSSFPELFCFFILAYEPSSTTHNASSMTSRCRLLISCCAWTSITVSSGISRSVLNIS